MKKSCFFTTIILLTFSIGIGFYIVKKYGHQFKEYGKEKIWEITAENVYDKIDEIEESNYQDSLRAIVVEYIENLDKEDFENALEKTGFFFEKVGTYIDDNKIDSIEYNILKKFAKLNER